MLCKGVIAVEIWQYLLIVGGGLLLVAAACLLPGRFFKLFGTLALNLGMGLALLLVLNLLSAEQLLPLNVLTIAVSDILGMPGVATLAVLAAI